MRKSVVILAASLILILIRPDPLHAQVLSNLFSFDSLNGKDPRGGLVAGADGYFYGTTAVGGTGNAGTIFRISPQGEFITLVHFDGANGRTPEAALVDGGDGYFYGTTSSGGEYNRGTVFRVSPDGSFATVVHFGADDGSKPGPLVLGSDGDLYGTTFGVGADLGTIFKITAEDRIVTLVRFGGGKGEHPETLMQSRLDKRFFYGTTRFGGAGTRGTVFRMDTSGEFTVLASFSGPDGHTPHGDLLEDDEGNLYGTTIYGGAAGLGIIFRVNPEGGLDKLAEFRGNDGWYPAAGLIRGRDGVFYGTTSAGGSGASAGTLFRIAPPGEIGILARFSFVVGSAPVGRLVQDGEGNFYGTTRTGGTLGGHGAVFKLSMPTPRAAPIITSDLVSAGRVGEEFRYQIGASNEPTGYAASGLPAGLSLDMVTGLISGIPVREGTFRVEMSASNSGGTGKATLELTILAPAEPLPKPEPSPTPTPDPSPTPEPNPTPTPPTTPQGITSVKLLPSGRTVKAGKPAKLMVMVGNNSTQMQNVTVTFSSNNPAVSAPNPITVPVKGKKSATQKKDGTGRSKFSVPIPANVTSSTVITASVGGLSSSSTLTIKAGKK